MVGGVGNWLNGGSLGYIGLWGGFQGKGERMMSLAMRDSIHIQCDLELGDVKSDRCLIETML
jgi:hypothetical protein